MDPPLDPASPAGRLAALEAAADSPLDALVFRKAASVARVMCEARLQQATAMGAMGLAASLAEAGVPGVEAKSGFALSSAEGGGTQAMAHMWVEVDGRVVDLLYNTMYAVPPATQTPWMLCFCKRCRLLLPVGLGHCFNAAPPTKNENHKRSCALRA